MTNKLHGSLSILLGFLLVLTLVMPGTLTAPAAFRQAQAAPEAMPDGLMSTFLAASAQPFRAGAEGYRARSGGLEFTLSAGGLQAESDGLALSVALSGLGRGKQIAAMPAAEIVQAGNRLEYRRGTLTEWYRDTALGVEQGFTIHEAPRGAGPLVLRLDLITGLAGAADADGRGLSFTAPDGQSLRYDRLHAWDAAGAPLDASLSYAPGQVTIQVDDQGAAYPITVDPLVYVEQKVVAANGVTEDSFGYAVALDGNTALIGAYGRDVGGNDRQGAVYVFARNATSWSLEQELSASDGTLYDLFGLSVALSGVTAVVGAPGSIGGAAYVFTRVGTTWSQRAKLTAADGAAGDYFGESVAIDGSTILVGAYRDDIDANTDQGSAYVFVPNILLGWVQQAKLTAAGGAAIDNFGISVALAGSTALVGAYWVDVGANTDQGSAYVFTRNGTIWTQQAQLTAAGGEASDNFGYAVALDRDTALVGAYFDVAATVFTRSGTTWTQQAQLTATDGVVEDCFGCAVALDGDTAVVGAYRDDVGGNVNQGSAYVFTRSGTAWTQQAYLTASDGALEDLFGDSVALSGNTVLVGASGDDADQGSAYFYELSRVVYLPLVLMNAP